MRSQLLGVLFGAVVLAAGAAQAADPASALVATAPRVFKICTDQTYALCAVASCFVLNGLSYCQCDVKEGDSISLPFNFDRNQNVCTVNAEGKKNGYMVSTYSLPPSVVAPEGDQALYDCPAGTSNGAYAQCDGGVCFTSSKGQSFPGFAKPLAKNQVICSCPVTVATAQNSPAGYQITGPYPCQRSFFANCKKAVANTNTGATIYVGAPTGVPRLLTRELYGRVPPIHECRLPPWP
ncbi:MAG TPA: hypothetical protein VGM07_18345 [Stellaceae bacterium]|jgi:hypothetical protein